MSFWDTDGSQNLQETKTAAVLGWVNEISALHVKVLWIRRKKIGGGRR